MQEGRTLFGAGKLQARFRSLVRDHHDDLRAYVAYLTRRAPATDDLVQEAFLLAFDRMAQGSDFSGDPGKWLRGVARNLVRAWWRDSRRVLPDTADMLLQLADETDDAVARVIADENVALLGGCVQKLRDVDQDLLRRFYADGLGVAQVAQQIKQSVSNVKVRLHRVRAALRECLGKSMLGVAP